VTCGKIWRVANRAQQAHATYLSTSLCVYRVPSRKAREAREIRFSVLAIRESNSAPKSGTSA
jgi:hypothetical protein